MPDGISFSLITKPFKDMTVEANRVTDKATMFALRQTGRDAGKVARSKLTPGAGVYSGTDPRAQAESGQLRKSIKNSKRLTRTGVGSYSMKVGPFGTKKAGSSVTRSASGALRGVQLYRGKIEVLFGYMAAGTTYVGTSVAKANFEEAYDKAFQRFR